MNIKEAKMQNYKIKVATEAESKEAQELLFELGYGWKHSGKKLINHSIPILYTELGIIYCGDEEIGQEITLPQLRDLVEEKNGLAVNSGYKISGLFSDLDQPKQMTWQDALRAVADGKEVEMIGLINEWVDIKEFNMCRIMGASEFRLAPQRKTLNGNFTKEELLKIVGEMG